MLYEKSGKILIIRKSICILITLSIVFSTFVIFADVQPGPEFSVSSASGYKGDKVKINIGLDRPKDVAGIQFSIKYDKNILNVSEENITKGPAMEGWLYVCNVLKDKGEIKFAFASSSGLKATNPVNVCSIDFSIKSDAQYGEYPVIIDSAFAGDGKQMSLLESASGKVSVIPKDGNNTVSIIPAISFVITAISSVIPTSTNKPTANISATPVTTPTPVSVTEPVSKKPSVGAFTDISGHWAFEYIKDLIERGILAGDPDGKMRPDCTISRAETVTLVIKSLGLKPALEYNLKFKDDKNIPDWAKGYIQAAFDDLLIHGYDDNTIRANGKLTRSEMAVLIMKAFDFGKAENRDLKYRDAGSIPNWARDFVAAAYANGIITGYSDNTFKPNNIITRAEVFVIISRCLKMQGP